MKHPPRTVEQWQSILQNLTFDEGAEMFAANCGWRLYAEFTNEHLAELATVFRAYHLMTREKGHGQT
jgi:hypothetical protein